MWYPNMKAGSGAVSVHSRPTPPMRRPPSCRPRLKVLRRGLMNDVKALMTEYDEETEEEEEASSATGEDVRCELRGSWCSLPARSSWSRSEIIPCARYAPYTSRTFNDRSRSKKEI